jgi:hypothetical protein
LTVPGYNPLRWSCDDRGCYNVKHRPKIEYFAGALPGKIALTDVDATTEVNGHFLFLEWKSGEPRDLPVGQRIYAQRLTGLTKKITYIVVCGDAETMEVVAIRPVWAGRIYDWETCDLETLYERIQAWASRVKLQALPRAA